MRSFSFAVAAYAAGLSFACAAAAESPWYLSGDVGGYFRQQDSFATTFYKPGDPLIRARGAQTRDFDGGLTGHLALGYRFSPHLRLEGELGETGYNVSTVYPNTTDPNFPRLNGSPWTASRAPYFHRFSGAANAFYDFRPLGQVTPYVGLGLGAWEARRTGGYFTKSGAVFTTSGGSAVEAFGQAEAGVSIRLSRHWSVAPAYRFVRGLASNSDTAHVVKVGLRYGF